MGQYVVTATGQVFNGDCGLSGRHVSPAAAAHKEKVRAKKHAKYKAVREKLDYVYEVLQRLEKRAGELELDKDVRNKIKEVARMACSPAASAKKEISYRRGGWMEGTVSGAGNKIKTALVILDSFWKELPALSMSDNARKEVQRFIVVASAHFKKALATLES